MSENQTMYFPNTVDEFMEQYKMVDYKEIYSNGTEYVPIFRMKQWFEAHPTPTKAEICREFYNECIMRETLLSDLNLTSVYLKDVMLDLLAEMGQKE